MDDLFEMFAGKTKKYRPGIIPRDACSHAAPGVIGAWFNMAGGADVIEKVDVEGGGGGGVVVLWFWKGGGWYFVI